MRALRSLLRFVAGGVRPGDEAPGRLASPGRRRLLGALAAAPVALPAAVRAAMVPGPAAQGLALGLSRTLAPGAIIPWRVHNEPVMLRSAQDVSRSFFAGPLGIGYAPSCPRFDIDRAVLSAAETADDEDAVPFGDWRVAALVGDAGGGP